MSFTIIRESAAKAYIEERIPSVLIGQIDELALTLDFIYDFIDKGDYEVDQDLYKYIADILDNTEFIESEPIVEAVDRVSILTNMHNKSDITIYELIKGFNDVFSTDIRKVSDGEDGIGDNVERTLNVSKSVDRFYNEISDILGISREQLIDNVLTASMANMLSASSEGMKNMLPIQTSEVEKEKEIEAKKEDIDKLKDKFK